MNLEDLTQRCFYDSQRRKRKSKGADTEQPGSMAGAQKDTRLLTEIPHLIRVK